MHLFDHLVKPVLLYGCEIWGPVTIRDAPLHCPVNFWKKISSDFPIASKFSLNPPFYEKIHLKFCKNILGVNIKTSNIGIYGDLGRYPLYINIVNQCSRYLTHLKETTTNVLSKNFFDEFDLIHGNSRSPDIQTFVTSTRNILKRKKLHNHCNKRKKLISHLQSNFRDYWWEMLNTEESRTGVGNNKLRTYNKFKTDHELESYLSPKISRENIIAIARLRLSAHKLNIECLRYNNKNNYIPPADRICTNCDLNKIENESHFLVECPNYDALRRPLFNEFISQCNNFSQLDLEDKFVYIMSNENEKCITALGNFIRLALRIRN